MPARWILSIISHVSEWKGWKVSPEIGASDSSAATTLCTPSWGSASSRYLVASYGEPGTGPATEIPIPRSIPARPPGFRVPSAIRLTSKR